MNVSQMLSHRKAIRHPDPDLFEARMRDLADLGRPHVASMLRAIEGGLCHELFVWFKVLRSNIEGGCNNRDALLAVLEDLADDMIGAGSAEFIADWQARHPMMALAPAWNETNPITLDDLRKASRSMGCLCVDTPPRHQDDGISSRFDVFDIPIVRLPLAAKIHWKPENAPETAPVPADVQMWPIRLAKDGEP